MQPYSAILLLCIRNYPPGPASYLLLTGKLTWYGDAVFGQVQR